MLVPNWGSQSILLTRAVVMHLMVDSTIIDLESFVAFSLVNDTLNLIFLLYLCLENKRKNNGYI